MNRGRLPTVDYECVGGVGWIWLNRPDRLNAVVLELVEDLCAALDQAVADEAGAVVIAGRGRAFCAGHDLREDREFVDPVRRAAQLQMVQDVTRKVRRAPHPVIAAVHGYALGAGCEFALCSDLVVAAAGTRFGFPEVGVGLTVTGGISHVLPLAVGLARAKELLLLGEQFDAERALELGLVNRVVAPEALEDEAERLARTLRGRPRLATALAKNALDQGAQLSLAAALDLEVNQALVAQGSPEALAAEQAFRRRKVEERCPRQ